MSVESGRAVEGREPLAVLHVTQPVTEGVGHFVRFLVTGQHERGHRVGLACAADSELAAEARQLGTTVLPWSARRDPGPSLAIEVQRLRSGIQQFRPDVIHLHSAKAGLVGRLLLRGTRPTVFQPNAWSFEASRGPMRSMAVAWERRAARWTDALVLVSRQERDQARRHRILARQGDVIVVNPVDVNRFHPLPDEARADLRRQLRLPPGPLVICVGRLCQQKGQDVLLQAWSHVNAAVPSAQLLLVGDGPLHGMLERSAPGNVHFLGLRHDVPQLLQAADLVVLPSRWEGMALTMLEAMATARSVVITNVGGAEETVGQGAGSVVPAGDHGALSSAIVRRLLDPDLARSEGEQGRRIVTANHTVAAVLRSVDEVYRSVRIGEPVNQSRRRAVAPSS